MGCRNCIATESEQQIALVEWAALVHKVRLVHIANEGKRTTWFGNRLKKLGMRKGFPDLLLFIPRKGFFGLAIELKRDKASKLTPEQREWLAELNSHGYLAKVGYGIDEAQEIINDYLKV